MRVAGAHAAPAAKMALTCRACIQRHCRRRLTSLPVAAAAVITATVALLIRRAIDRLSSRRTPAAGETLGDL